MCNKDRLFRYEKKKEISVPLRVLIIRFSSIGDIILTTPLLSAIKRDYPGARIEYLTMSEYSSLLENNPNIDRLHTLRRGEGPGSEVRAAISLRKNDYDYIFDLHRSTRSLLFRALLRGKKFVLNKHYIRRLLLTKFSINLYREPYSVVNRYFKAAEIMGLDVDGKAEIWIDGDEIHDLIGKIKTKLDLDINEKDIGRGKKRLENGLVKNEGAGIIALMPFAKWKTKEWGDNKFIELGKVLAKEMGKRVFVLGGKGDAERAQRIADEIGDGAISAAGKLSLMETSFVLSLSDLLITNDTGLMHIGGAVSIPVIAIFGSTARELGFFPYNTRGEVIEVPLKCRPCTAKGLDRCPEGHFACMNDISVDRVYDAITAFFAG